MSQPLSIREQMKALEHLQEFDLKIDALKKRKTALPVALKALEDSYNKLRLGVEAKKNAIGEIEKTQRQTQAAIDLNRDRLTRSNSKLESVQNSHEFQAASKEIEQLKKMNLSLEEQLKKSKQDIEAIQKEIEQQTVEMDKAKAELDAQAATLFGEAGQLDTQIAALNTERSKYSVLVETRTLSQYDRVRGARAGLGIVPALGGRCSGCNMMVPPQLYNELHRAQAIQACPSCHRILYVPAQPGAGSEKGASAENGK